MEKYLTTENLTIGMLGLICFVSLYFLEIEAKEVVIAVSGGLVGYLTKGSDGG